MNGSLLVSLAACLLAGHVVLGCSEQAPAATPPPLPPMPTLVPVEAEAEAVAPYAPPASSSAREKKPAKNKPQSAAAPAHKAAPSAKTESHASAPKQTSAPRANAPAPMSSPRVEPTVTPAPAAVVPAPVARPASSKRVAVPRTANVHIEFPAGLQADLDADPRMQSWVDKVVSIIDGCHANNRGAKGTISTRVTMHENDRPDADILSLPGQLSSVVACATGSLMRVKMPLFTGREGTRHDVRIVFE